MPSYLALGKYTQQGLDTMGELGDRLAATKQTVSDAGGRLIFFYMTFGQYDFAALTEMPDDEAAARLDLRTGQPVRREGRPARAGQLPAAAGLVGVGAIALRQWLLPGLIANVAYLRAQLSTPMA